MLGQPKVKHSYSSNQPTGRQSNQAQQEPKWSVLIAWSCYKPSTTTQQTQIISSFWRMTSMQKLNHYLRTTPVSLSWHGLHSATWNKLLLQQPSNDYNTKRQPTNEDLPTHTEHESHRHLHQNLVPRMRPKIPSQNHLTIQHAEVQLHWFDPSHLPTYTLTDTLHCRENPTHQLKHAKL